MTAEQTTRQRQLLGKPVNCNRVAVISLWPARRCYKQDSQSVSEDREEFVGELVSPLEVCCGSVVVSCCCEKLVDDARRQLGNSEEEECSPLKPLPSNG
jgi:hypothetical protein